MCNLYSMTKGQAAIIALTRAMVDRTGNLPPMPGIFPDYAAPIVRNEGPERVLTLSRWGMPSPQFALKGKDGKPKKTDPGVTNIRNSALPHWRRWLGVENRCVVPFTSFSEFNKDAGGDIWFAIDESRPLNFFAGIWVPQWRSTRKVKEGEIEADLFGFLTTEPNAEVGAIHPKAMPVILTTQDEIETWLTASTSDALKLQRPLPDISLKIVGRGVKKDENAPIRI
jgi:putative SOS response-associated peptidase YedK